MPSEKSPAFSFYSQDFLLGTMLLSLPERGAYITLLAYQWDHGSVPSDHTGLARICGCPERQMAQLWLALGAKFPRGADGQCRNVRLESERTKQAIRRAKLAANGQKGGRPAVNLDESKRFGKDKPK